MPITVLNGPTIQAGQSLSNSANLQGRQIVGLLVPLGLPSTCITFQLSQGANDFHDLYSIRGDLLKIYPVPGARLVFDTDWALIADFMKIRTGTPDDPIVQTAVRVFKTLIST
jgi:hypothetical protein